MNELHAAPNLESVRGMGDCHELQGDMKGCFAIDLQGPYRMIFKPNGKSETYIENKSIIWEKVVEVEILQIIDYHK